MIHTVKIYPEYFESILSGTKTLELCEEDEYHFAIGDVLVLREWGPVSHGYMYEVGQEIWLYYDVDYTGRECRVVVTHILADVPEQPMVVLSVRLVKEEPL